MRIVHLIWAFPIGGAETMLSEILNLQRLHANVTLLIINNIVSEDLLNTVHNDVRIIKIDRPPKSRNLWYPMKLWFSILYIRPHVIHCHNEGLIKFLFLLKSNVCLTIHNNKVPTDNLKYYKKLFVISKAVKDWIFDITKLDSVLVYNGINLNSITEKKIFHYDTFKIVQISRLEHNIKGQDVLIRALGYLVYELGVTNVRLDLIGKGPSLEYLKTLVTEESLGDLVHFKGEIDKARVYKTICEYNLLVQPSKYEGFGLTVVEGMAANVPVLVSDIDGPIEIIEHGRYGLYFKSGDPIDCAIKLKDIIKNYRDYTTPDKLSKIRNYVITNFDISKTAINYLNAYKF